MVCILLEVMGVSVYVRTFGCLGGRRRKQKLLLSTGAQGVLTCCTKPTGQLATLAARRNRN